MLDLSFKLIHINGSVNIHCPSLTIHNTEYEYPTNNYSKFNNTNEIVYYYDTFVFSHILYTSSHFRLWMAARCNGSTLLEYEMVLFLLGLGYDTSGFNTWSSISVLTLYGRNLTVDARSSRLYELVMTLSNKIYLLT